jgi:hypothetical protein
MTSPYVLRRSIFNYPMKPAAIIRPLLLAAVFGFSAHVGIAQTTEPAFPDKVQTAPIPKEFRDPETGLRLLHLSRFPSNYASVVYTKRSGAISIRSTSLR